MSDADTIVALATAGGQAGIGVVRVSGPRAQAVMLGACGRKVPARHASLVRFRDAGGDTIDEGIALYFPGPQSYTGEDVLELQAHGGPVVLRMLIERCVELGARRAQPGEFTRRAFLNDKLDLTQAEAVADLISASTDQAARSAMRSLQGEFSKRVHDLQAQLTQIRVFVEATLDFPDEDIDPRQQAQVPADLRTLTQSIDATLAVAAQGSLLRDGLRVALIGAPNVGKSSILNVLSKEEVAIVTPIPGTTRDLVRQSLQINGLPIHIIDTAGLRSAQDPIEAIGIERTWETIANADLVLLVSDVAQPDTDLMNELRGKLPLECRVIQVRNKIDLTGRPAAILDHAEQVEVWISAKTGAGVELLANAIAQAAGWTGETEGLFMARGRHLEALARCRVHLNTAVEVLPGAELVAEELRQAQLALSELTGEVASDDLLGEIFARFCIGK